MCGAILQIPVCLHIISTGMLPCYTHTHIHTQRIIAKFNHFFPFVSLCRSFIYSLHFNTEVKNECSCAAALYHRGVDRPNFTLTLSSFVSSFVCMFPSI
jgi:hypothetical protein